MMAKNKKGIHRVVDGCVDKMLTYKHEDLSLIPQIRFKNNRHGGACL